MKKVFAFYRAQDKSKLNKYLKDNFEIETKSDFHFKDGFVMYADETNYLETYQKGREYLNSIDLEGNVYYYDNYNNYIPLNFIPFLYLKFPKERIVDHDWWVYSKYPIDIETFNDFLKLKFQLEAEDLKIFVNKEDNSLVYYLNSDKKDKLYSLDDILYDKDNYIINFVNNNMLGIEYIDTHSIWDLNKEKKILSLKHFSEYLKKSFFLRNIYSTNLPEKDFNGGFKSTEHKKSVDEFNLRKVISTNKDDEKEIVFGNFRIRETKKYTEYHNTIDNKITSISNEQFILIDNGNFKIQFWISNHGFYKNPLFEVNLEISIELLRNVIGYDYENNCIADKIFNGKLHENIKDKIVLNEHFKVLDDKKWLLHYNDYNDEIEITSITDTWTPKDGMQQGCFYFSSTEELENDGFMNDEIRELLNSREWVIANDCKKKQKSL